MDDRAVTTLRGAELRARPTEAISVAELGTVPYRDAWSLQRRLVEAHAADPTGTPDTVLMLEHPPVYTLGRRADPAHVLLDRVRLADRGIDVVEVDRGGDVTYHGPGQLVAYPILRLARSRGVVDYVRLLEDVVIRALATLDVVGGREPGLTGVWVEGAKVAAIGVRVAAGGITSHGLALNVAPRLEDFGGIVPCGIADRAVTSLRALGSDADMPRTVGALVGSLAAEFGVPTVTLDPQDLTTSAGLPGVAA